MIMPGYSCQHLWCIKMKIVIVGFSEQDLTHCCLAAAVFLSPVISCYIIRIIKKIYLRFFKLLLMMIGQAKQNVFAMFNFTFDKTIHLAIHCNFAVDALKIPGVSNIRQTQRSPDGNQVCFIIIFFVQGKLDLLLPLLLNKIKPASVAYKVKEE